MRVHLNEESTIDAAIGEASADVRRHLDACPECLERVAHAREGLDLAAAAEMPEPPPLYWESFRRQVGHRVAEEPRRRVVSWWAPVLAAAAAVLIATAVSRRQAPAVTEPTPAVALPAWSALPPAEEDSGLDVLKAYAITDDTLETALPSDSVAGTLADLSEDESADLAEALRRELGAAEAL
jgi:hypothetical protein